MIELLSFILIVLLSALIAIAARNKKGSRESIPTNAPRAVAALAIPPPVPMPRYVAAVDVETTGLEVYDRVVSLGIILIDMDALARVQKFELQVNHLIFNPGRPSHPDARRVHGYSDALLCSQESFADHLGPICELIDAAELIVAHNAEFDLSFINRELAACNRPRITTPSFCTMRVWRERFSGSASLPSAAAHIGLRRAARQHNAIEDAWLALMVFLYLHGRSPIIPFKELGIDAAPRNLRPISPELSTTEQHDAPELSIPELHDAIVAAKREGRYADAEALLLHAVEECERQADRFGVSSWAYEFLAIEYRRQKRAADEIAILQRYLARQDTRARDAKRIKERLSKVEMRTGVAKAAISSIDASA
jgi:DNA polymerase-3 subunit epsilon